MLSEDSRKDGNVLFVDLGRHKEALLNDFNASSHTLIQVCHVSPLLHFHEKVEQAEKKSKTIMGHPPAVKTIISPQPIAKSGTPAKTT